jgi:hypothetical protein
LDQHRGFACQAKRVTSGVLVGNGFYFFNNLSVLAKVYSNDQERRDKQMDATRKK